MGKVETFPIETESQWTRAIHIDGGPNYQYSFSCVEFADTPTNSELRTRFNAELKLESETLI